MYFQKRNVVVEHPLCIHHQENMIPYRLEMFKDVQSDEWFVYYYSKAYMVYYYTTVPNESHVVTSVVVLGRKIINEKYVFCIYIRFEVS